MRIRRGPATVTPGDRRARHSGCRVPTTRGADPEGRLPHDAQRMFTLLSTSDTDLLSARASALGLAARQPRTGSAPTSSPRSSTAPSSSSSGSSGPPRSTRTMLAPLLAGGLPVVVLGGEQVPDAELMALSTVPMGVATEAHAYLAQGGPDNLVQLHRFLVRHRAAHRRGLRAARRRAGLGPAGPPDAPPPARRVAVLYYRAHHLAGNTAFVQTLCDAIETAGGVRAAGLHRLAARGRPGDCSRCCARSTPWSSRCWRPAAPGRPPPRPVGTTAPGTSASSPRLDVPVIQGLCLSTPRETWAANDDGLSPLDVGNQVAIPEFDGRIISVPFSFKEVDDDGLTSYVRRPRAGRPRRRHRRRPRPAAAHPAGRPEDRRDAVGVPDQALAHRQRRRPGHPRVGRPAAGRDAGAGLRHRPVRRAGRAARRRRPGRRRAGARAHRGRRPGPGLADRRAAVRQPGAHPGRASTAPSSTRCPPSCTDRMVEHWGPPPGELFVDDPTRRTASCSPPCAPATSS